MLIKSNIRHNGRENTIFDTKRQKELDMNLHLELMSGHL